MYLVIYKSFFKCFQILWYIIFLLEVVDKYPSANNKKNLLNYVPHVPDVPTCPKEILRAYWPCE